MATITKEKANKIYDLLVSIGGAYESNIITTPKAKMVVVNGVSLVNLALMVNTEVIIIW
jgi:hypothetical protein